MRGSRALYGGQERFKYPTYVWSPAGGWWNNARPDWKRNTMIAAAGVFVATALVFKVSADNERRYKTPERPIPSQRWARHTLEDDPDYYAKREEYHRNKKSFLDRLLPDSHDGHH